MQYGAMNFPIRSISDEIRSIAALGFDYLELAMDPPEAHYTLIRQQKDEILNTLSEHSLGLVCHLPTFVYTADLTESIRKASLEEMLHSLEVISDLGSPKTVLHPSIVSGLGEFVKDTVREYSLEALNTIMEKARSLGIRLCFENMFPRYGAFAEPDEFAEIFERFPDLRMTLDTGHAHIGNKQGSRNIKFIRRFPDRIAHIHISDNSGKQDDHLAIGKGTINFREIIKELVKAGYDETVTFEIFSENRTELKSGREKFDSVRLWALSSFS